MVEYKTNDPFCEHCMDLEQGSFTFDDDGISWCISCYYAGGKINDQECAELCQKEKESIKDAMKKRLKELES